MRQYIFRLECLYIKEEITCQCLPHNFSKSLCLLCKNGWGNNSASSVSSCSVCSPWCRCRWEAELQEKGAMSGESETSWHRGGNILCSIVHRQLYKVLRTSITTVQLKLSLMVLIKRVLSSHAVSPSSVYLVIYESSVLFWRCFLSHLCREE